MRIEYQDRWITCTPDEITIRGYYFPWGTKHIPYASIRSVHRVKLGVLTGRGRIWGTSNPSRWASLDPSRTSKTVGFDLDLGASVKPLLTPDAPDEFEHALRAHVGADVVGPGGRRSSFV